MSIVIYNQACLLYDKKCLIKFFLAKTQYNVILIISACVVIQITAIFKYEEFPQNIGDDLDNNQIVPLEYNGLSNIYRNIIK